MTLHNYTKGLPLLLVLSSSCFASNFNLPPTFEALQDQTFDSSIETIFPPELLTLPEAPAIALTLKSDQPSFAVGEHLSFTIKTDTDCYLTLINEGQSGKTTVLFPNKARQNTLIKSGELYAVPGDELLPIAALKVARPKNTINDYESIEAICHIENTPAFKSNYDFSQYAYRTFERSDNWRKKLSGMTQTGAARKSIQISIE